MNKVTEVLSGIVLSAFFIVMCVGIMSAPFSKEVSRLLIEIGIWIFIFGIVPLGLWGFVSLIIYLVKNR